MTTSQRAMFCSVSSLLSTYQRPFGPQLPNPPCPCFLTMTFATTLDFAVAAGCWDRYLGLMTRWAKRNGFAPFGGVRVFELHQLHGLHVHAVITHRYPVDVVRRLGIIAGFGVFVHVKEIEDNHPDRVAAYMSKYLSKQHSARAECLKGKRLWANFGAWKQAGTRVKDMVSVGGAAMVTRALKVLLSGVDGVDWCTHTVAMGLSGFAHNAQDNLRIIQQLRDDIKRRADDLPSPGRGLQMSLGERGDYQRGSLERAVLVRTMRRHMFLHMGFFRDFLKNLTEKQVEYLTDATGLMIPISFV